MKRLLLAAVALPLVATTASAADLQARPYTKAPPPVVSPAYNWSGFYVGAMGGGAFSSDTGSGGFGGGTIGYNWQFPGGASSVFGGVEVDAAGASIKDSFTEDQGRNSASRRESKINSFGSVTGRAGFAMGCGASLRQGRLCLGQQQGHDFMGGRSRVIFG